MKKLFYTIFILCASALFVSCGDDDDKGGEEPKDPNDMTIEEYMSEDRPFVWNGDWNDPEDPNYKPGGYNPIEGYWQSSTINTLVYYYTKDWEELLYDYDAARKTLVHREGWTIGYEINNRAFWKVKDRDGNCLFYGLDATKKILYINDLGKGAGEGMTIKKKNWEKREKFDISGVDIIGTPEK